MMNQPTNSTNEPNTNRRSDEWTRDVIRVRIFVHDKIDADERSDRDGYRSPSVPGLVIMENDLSPRGALVPWLAFGITHEASGRALAKWFTRLDSAKDFALALVALPLVDGGEPGSLDWTITDPDVFRKNASVAARVIALRRQHYGRDSHAAALPQSGVSLNFLTAVEGMRKREHQQYNDMKSRAYRCSGDGNE